MRLSVMHKCKRVFLWVDHIEHSSTLGLSLHQPEEYTHTCTQVTAVKGPYGVTERERESKMTHFHCSSRTFWNSVTVFPGDQTTRQRRPGHRPHTWWRERDGERNKKCFVNDVWCFIQLESLESLLWLMGGWAMERERERDAERWPCFKQASFQTWKLQM